MMFSIKTRRSAAFSTFSGYPRIRTIKMFKALAILLVLGVACQAAPSTSEPRDFRVVILNGIKIVRIIGDAIVKGIDDATPAVQAIEGEMDAQLAAQLKGLLLRIKGDIQSVITKIQELEAQLNTSIANIAAAAGKCQDAAETSLKPILNSYGNVLAKLIESIGDQYREELDSVYNGAKDLGDRLHATNIAGVKGGEACVVGKKNVKECLDANGVDFTTDLTTDLADAVLLLNEALPLLNTTVTDFLSGLQPGFNDTRTKADAVFVTFGSCVEAS